MEDEIQPLPKAIFLGLGKVRWARTTTNRPVFFFFATAETHNVAFLRRDPSGEDGSRGRNFPALKKEYLSIRNRVQQFQNFSKRSSSQTSRHSSTDAAFFFFSAQLTENSLALSTRKKGSGHPEGLGPEPFCAFSTEDEACSLSFRQASREGAPANGWTRTSDSSETPRH